jgi:hypothetical protein
LSEDPIKGEMVRDDDGKFVQGVSGNPGGRPKGSKNKITLLRQSLELQLREQAAPNMGDVLRTAVALALDGDRAMIKLLLEMHMSKSAPEDSKGAERVAIQINNLASPKKGEVIDVTPTEETDDG